MEFMSYVLIAIIILVVIFAKMGAEPRKIYVFRCHRPARTGLRLPLAERYYKG